MEILPERKRFNGDHICKKCGKDFKSEHFKKICPECFGEVRKENVSEFMENYSKIRQIERWVGRVGLIEVIRPEQEKYDEDFFVPRTMKICAICGEFHETDKKYYHLFSTKQKALGIAIEDLEELIRELKGNNQNLKQFLKERGLTEEIYKEESK